MIMPLKNIIYDLIREQNSIIDIDLSKTLSKDGYVIHIDQLNKILLDLEILGLIKLSWFTKNSKRIEITDIQKDDTDKIELNNDIVEKDYEASFPGT